MFETGRMVFFICVVSFALCYQAHGDIYRCVNDDGVAYLTNTTLKPGCKKILLENKDSSEKDSNENNISNSFDYYVEIGPFKDLDEAKNLKKKLNANGIETHYYKKHKGKYILWLGNFLTRDEAREKAQKLNDAKLIGRFKIFPPEKVYPAQAVESGNSRLKQQAKKMELAIWSAARNMGYGTRAELSRKWIQPKCDVKPDEHGKIGIACSLRFPKNYSIGYMDYKDMREYHNIQALTRDLAVAFARNEIRESFWIESSAKFNGKYMLVCGFYYNKNLDSLTPVYTD
ncbi:MAG: SPOR domain-containing protein [Deltaproteobacteria bacterium]